MKKLLFTVAGLSLCFFVHALPDGYGKIKLGMTLDDTKAALKSDLQYGYRGDRDVSLTPSDKQYIIETDGSKSPGSFFRECWFQFNDDKLYTIVLNVDSKKMDYYTMFKALCDKYGNPQSLNPQKAFWGDDKVLMSLERPLTLKYIDKNVYDSKINNSAVKESAVEYSRNAFIEGL